jgi:hypothetical protein
VRVCLAASACTRQRGRRREREGGGREGLPPLGGAAARRRRRRDGRRRLFRAALADGVSSSRHSSLAFGARDASSSYGRGAMSNRLPPARHNNAAVGSFWVVVRAWLGGRQVRNVIAGLTLDLGAADGKPSKLPRRQVQSIIDRLDKNHDGVVTCVRERRSRARAARRAPRAA